MYFKNLFYLITMEYVVLCYSFVKHFSYLIMQACYIVNFEWSYYD